MERILKYLGLSFLLIIFYFVYILSSWPKNPTYEQIETQAEFEEKCFGDSTFAISLKEKMFCDSMLKTGYDKFEIIHKRYFSKCDEVKNYDKTVLVMKFNKKNITHQPSTAEINLKSQQLLMHLLRIYLTHDERSEFTKFEAIGVIGKEFGGADFGSVDK